MEELYPASERELEPWRRRFGVSADEARKRFLQYVVLESIASAPDLAASVAFKGGNALRFVYGNRRSTLDLDFTADAAFPDAPAPIRALLDNALRSALPRFRVKARCQRLRRNPPGLDKVRPTYDISVGCLLPGDRLYQNFDDGTSLPSTIDVEISLNEVVCEAVPHRFQPGGRELRVCSLEDILAEKLRALLQQPVRRRSRPQDVFDIASMVRRLGGAIDAGKVASYLIRKAEAREIRPSKAGFDTMVRRLASQGYDAEIGPKAPDFIPFDVAWAEVVAFISGLAIPEA